VEVDVQVEVTPTVPVSAISVGSCYLSGAQGDTLFVKTNGTAAAGFSLAVLLATGVAVEHNNVTQVTPVTAKVVRV
jgi:hypothetical protein